MKASAAATALLAFATGSNALSTPGAPVVNGRFSNLLPGEVDVRKAYAESTFPIAPENLILRAKEVLSPQLLIGLKDDGKCLANDFEFVAAVIGPWPKDEYLEALGAIKLEDSFDVEPNYFGFTVDPIQPHRVWFFGRSVAKHIAPFMGAKPEDTMDAGVLTLPPQVTYLDFNDDGLVKEFGFYTVDRRHGNTGGLGGAFGYFYGVGKPFPIRECQPFKSSFWLTASRKSRLLYHSLRQTGSS